jgi:hypothetical protein
VTKSLSAGLLNGEFQTLPTTLWRKQSTLLVQSTPSTLIGLFFKRVSSHDSRSNTPGGVGSLGDSRSNAPGGVGINLFFVTEVRLSIFTLSWCFFKSVLPMVRLLLERWH